MEHESVSLAAATLAAAILDKTELPPGTDVVREAMRLYRITLRRVQSVHDESEKKPAAEHEAA